MMRENQKSPKTGHPIRTACIDIRRFEVVASRRSESVENEGNEQDQLKTLMEHYSGKWSLDFHGRE